MGKFIEKNFFYVAIFLSLGFLFQFFSCKIQSKDNDSSSAQHKEVATFEPTQTWHVGNECICILFGYGYNDKDFAYESRGRKWQFQDHQSGQSKQNCLEQFCYVKDTRKMKWSVTVFCHLR
ncbi:MAG: hypothetical protein IKI31_00160 [Treponema sp.]|nr:hypothetical protein [Treponema sp.]